MMTALARAHGMVCVARHGESEGDGGDEDAADFGFKRCGRQMQREMKRYKTVEEKAARCSVEGGASDFLLM